MGGPMLDIDGLAKRYGSVVALDDASFQAANGRILGFLGPNGAGKSTTMPVILVAVASLAASMFFVLRSSNAVAVTILTLLPPSAPIAIPIRAALGSIEPWEIALSAVITIVTIVAVLWAGARVYSGFVLQVGSRMRLGDAWRAAGR
jgi:ABC-type Na+ efflux pump permease subunit